MVNNRRWWAVLLLAIATAGLSRMGAEPRGYAMTGLVIAVNPADRMVVISHDSVPGVMEAMAMPFDVRSARDLEGLTPGTAVRFTLVLDQSPHIEQIVAVPFESVEQDPLTAKRLALLQRRLTPSAPKVTTGEVVPDFSLADQARQPVSLASLRGKVVAINFIYTSCALPQFCYRIANHFGVVARRFQQRMGRDLVLLTVTFDPTRDTPERLAEYARQWGVPAAKWHFLTGTFPEVRRVCALFGVEAFPDEGLMNHSVHTVVIDRQGRLAANIEGNRASAAQVGDLIGSVLGR